MTFTPCRRLLALPFALPFALMAATVVVSCSSTNPQNSTSTQQNSTDHRELYRHIAVETDSGELRRAMTSDLASLGYNVVGAQAPTAAQASTAPGAIATVRVTESKPAWITLGSQPAYAASEKDAMRAHKAQVEVVVTRAEDGQPLATYRGTSKADESWSGRESERSALREAMRTFPSNAALTW